MTDAAARTRAVQFAEAYIDARLRGADSNASDTLIEHFEKALLEVLPRSGDGAQSGEEQRQAARELIDALIRHEPECAGAASDDANGYGFEWIWPDGTKLFFDIDIALLGSPSFSVYYRRGSEPYGRNIPIVADIDKSAPPPASDAGQPAGREDNLPEDVTLFALSMSDRACYFWPDDTAAHRRLREEYVQNAIDNWPANPADPAPAPMAGGETADVQAQKAIAGLEKYMVGHPRSAGIPWPHRELHDAKDSILALQAALATERQRRVEAVKALEPFAGWVESRPPLPDDTASGGWCGGRQITVGDLRRARKALATLSRSAP